MSAPVQLALEFEPRSAHERDDFLVAPSNADAIAWLDRWPDWGSSALVVYGPSASGKTHLSHVWQGVCRAIRCPVGEVAVREPRDLLAQTGAVVIDDADSGVDEAALFHLLNVAGELGASLLLTGREPPSRWAVALADLASRLNALPAVGLGPPDDGLLAALLVKQLADRQLTVGDEVASYLLGRMERSFEGVRWLVAALDRSSLAEHRRITVPLAREVLEGLEIRDKNRSPSS